ncbi:MAG: VCBS repeat-containing protein, partial [Bacteroidia bacterium]|nr:VCBS repeat-containing protein [Bacteroidia bacterium]
MKKWYTLFCFLCLTGMLRAQNIGFKYNNNLRFVNAAGDTLTNAFTGGFNAPQFNMIDINLDGKMDLLVFDRSGNILHPYINMGNPGEINYHYAPEYRNLFPRLINWVRIADYNHDGKMDIFTNADPNEPHDTNILVQINHVRIFKNVSSGSKLQFTLISPSISCEYWYGQDGVIVSPTDLPDVKDIDGDGDMDMVSIQNTGAFIYYFKNYQIEKGLPADSFKFYNVDTKWGGVMITEQITLGQTIEKSYFKMNHTSGTTVSLFDRDGDGDYDLYTGDPANDFLFYVKNGRVEYNWKYNGYSSDTMVAYDSITPRNTVRAKMPASLAAWFVDIDNDGKQDLIVSPNTLEEAKTKNNIWLYLNTGTVANAQFSYIKNNFLQEASIDIGDGLAPAALDYDQDGDADIIAATKGDYPYNPDETGRLVLFKNYGNATYPVFGIADTNYL